MRKTDNAGLTNMGDDNNETQQAKKTDNTGRCFPARRQWSRTGGCSVWNTQFRSQNRTNCILLTLKLLERNTGNDYDVILHSRAPKCSRPLHADRKYKGTLRSEFESNQRHCLEHVPFLMVSHTSRDGFGKANVYYTFVLDQWMQYSSSTTGKPAETFYATFAFVVLQFEQIINCSTTKSSKFWTN